MRPSLFSGFCTFGITHTTDEIEKTMVIRAFVISIVVFLYSCSGWAQVFEKPNAEIQSHTELTITRIDVTSDYTIVHLRNRNMLVTDAWACVDRNTIIRTSDNRQYSLIRAENIPFCPMKHRFDSLGEILEFTLYFPPVDPSKGRIDLVEICDQSCFFFKGIILDNKLNRDIHSYERAFNLYLEKDYPAARDILVEIVQEIPENPTHIYGFSYYYLILISHELGKSKETEAWYRELKNSTLPDRETIIRKIEELGIIDK